MQPFPVHKNIWRRNNGLQECRCGYRGRIPVCRTDEKACTCGKNDPEKIATIVSGVAEGCKQSGAALIGGETAEMPGFYPVDEYDLAGFAVGIVDEKDLITGKDLKAGDTLIGIASSGVHSNGFSLVRKVFSMSKEALDTYYDKLGCTLGEALIAPTKIYVKALKSIKEAGVTVKACSHITGGARRHPCGGEEGQLPDPADFWHAGRGRRDRRKSDVQYD